MNKQPLVSVLMTAYNREKYIAEAIESVMASTYQNWELIIVDDGSKDKTVEIAQAYVEKDSRIKVYINEKNLGDYPNRNKAASYAKGKYIKYLDSDDMIYPHGLQVMVFSMEKFPEAGFGLSAQNYSNKPFPIITLPKETYLEHFTRFGHFDRAPGSSIIKLAAFNAVGGFSGKRFIGDTEFWYKIGAIYPMVKFQRDLVFDRAHEQKEAKYEKENKKINKIRQNLIYEALFDKNCPLDKAQISQIIKANKRKKIKTKIKSMLHV